MNVEIIIYENYVIQTQNILLTHTHTHTHTYTHSNGDMVVWSYMWNHVSNPLQVPNQQVLWGGAVGYAFKGLLPALCRGQQSGAQSAPLQGTQQTVVWRTDRNITK